MNKDTLFMIVVPKEMCGSKHLMESHLLVLYYMTSLLNFYPQSSFSFASSSSSSFSPHFFAIINICLISFSGEVWPGPCVFPDFTQSNARSWWASLVKGFVSNGVDGIWNDMNEPAVFKVIPRSLSSLNSFFFN